MAINKVILLGNVGKEPEVRYPSQGQVIRYCNLCGSLRDLMQLS